MNKAHTAKQPSIEDLLASIRQAIHDDVAPHEKLGLQSEEPPRWGAADTDPLGEPGAEADNPMQGGDEPALKPARPDADGRPVQRTIVTSGGQAFAGLLGGDVRLEEALARLSHAGRRPAAAPHVSDSLRLRPAIDEPVERLHADDARPNRSATHQPQEPPEQRHEQPDERHQPADPPRPPWLTSQRSAAAGQAAGTAHDPGPPHTDPPWREHLHASEHHAPLSAPQRDGRAGASDLLSPEAAAAASSAFDRLADAIVQRSTGGERSIEEATRELLRPMLKNWLDQNLPRVVEELVREEIARVARNGK